MNTVSNEKRREAVNLIDSALTTLELDFHRIPIQTVIAELQQALLILDIEREVIS